MNWITISGNDLLDMIKKQLGLKTVDRGEVRISPDPGEPDLVLNDVP